MNLTHSKAYKSFLTFIKQEYIDNIITDSNTKILIGVSGGSDSVFLLLSMIEYLVETSQNMESKLGVAHINYSLRGIDSIDDQRFVRNLCEKKNIPFYTKTVEITQKSNLEAKCREIRFNFFTKLCSKYGYNIICLAHILEDRVENILMKMIKGGSLESVIQPMPKVDYGRLTIIRPLLMTTKENIIECLNSIGQKYQTDITNFKNIYLRNTIRNRILPIFSEIKPNWRKSTHKMLTTLQNDNEYLNQITEKFINKYLDTNSSIRIPIDSYINLHLSIRNRIIINSIKKISGYLSYLKQENIYKIDKFVNEVSQNNDKSGTIEIYHDKNIIVEIVYDLFVIKKNSNDRDNPINNIIIKVVEDLKTHFDYLNFHISSKLERYLTKSSFKVKSKFNNNIKMFIQLDYEDLFLRFRRINNGDKISIAKGKKKSINKILGDIKIPIAERKKSIVLEICKNKEFLKGTDIVAFIIYNNLKKSRVSYDYYVNIVDGQRILELDIVYY